MTINKGIQVCMSRKEMGEMALHNSRCFLTVPVIGKVSVLGGTVVITSPMRAVIHDAWLLRS